ncbi:MAG: NAD-dependent epimerase/dehydratase family protein [Bryobacterales bacterium]|nr:NAD-dependent epimerase/dehydratase family protein [Bryobacterales bacterium]
MSYEGKRVVVTGGLGFIGSNLVLRLVERGASVTVVDSCVQGCGANLFNLAPASGKVEILKADIGEPDCIAPALAGVPIIFNLAGEISHIHSMLYPERDLEINTLSQMRFLEACIRLTPGARVVYAGTRQVYGAPHYLPVDELHPVNPVDFNGVHKYAATMYHLMFSRSGDLDAVVLRLTNVYGPRMALDVPCQGFLSNYIRKSLAAARLQVFGDGSQLRDPAYVDDVVEAMLAGAAERLQSREYNVGGPEALSLSQIAAICTEAGGMEPPEFREFPPDRKQIDIGSYYTDSSRIGRELGWSPKVRFQDGIGMTLDYYRQCLPRYLPPGITEPECKLRHILMQKGSYRLSPT